MSILGFLIAAVFGVLALLVPLLRLSAKLAAAAMQEEILRGSALKPEPTDGSAEIKADKK